MLKKCAAKYSMGKGKLDKVIGEAIIEAAEEVNEYTYMLNICCPTAFSFRSSFWRHFPFWGCRPSIRNPITTAYSPKICAPSKAPAVGVTKGESAHPSITTAHRQTPPVRLLSRFPGCRSRYRLCYFHCFALLLAVHNPTCCQPRFRLRKGNSTTTFRWSCFRPAVALRRT